MVVPAAPLTVMIIELHLSQFPTLYQAEHCHGWPSSKPLLGFWVVIGDGGFGGAVTIGASGIFVIVTLGVGTFAALMHSQSPALRPMQSGPRAGFQARRWPSHRWRSAAKARSMEVHVSLFFTWYHSLQVYGWPGAVFAGFWVTNGGPGCWVGVGGGVVPGFVGDVAPIPTQ